MKHLTSCLALAACLAIPALHAADETEGTEIIIGLGKNGVQKTQSAVTLAARPYVFATDIDIKTGEFGDRCSVLLPTGGLFTLNGSDVDSSGRTLEYDFVGQYSSSTRLSQAFPTGTYQVTLKLTGRAAATVSLPIKTKTFPELPRIINFNAAQSIDSTQSFVLNRTTVKEAQAGDVIALEIEDTVTGEDVVEREIFKNPISRAATGITLPAGRLQPGRKYTVILSFVQVDSRTAASSPEGFSRSAIVASTTTLTIETDALPVP
jgi:hypothetical protein